MKKLFSLVLVIALVLSLGAGVFAQEVPAFEAVENSSSMQPNFWWPGWPWWPPKDPKPVDPDETVPIGKLFELKYENTVSPAESFNFKIEKFDVKNSEHDINTMPMFNPSTFSIDFSQGEATEGKANELVLPNYDKVGVYQYKLTEIEGNSAGVVYDDRELILTVYVLYGENGELETQVTLHEHGKDAMAKVDGFTNKFMASGLDIYKKVSGNMGDKNQEFNITVELNAPAGKEINSPIFVDGNEVNLVDGKLELTIKHDQTIRLRNLPFGVTYTVTEEDLENYEEEISFGSGAIGKYNKSVVIKNHSEQVIETGINLDNLPYILILGAATIGLFGFTAKKRFSRED